MSEGCIVRRGKKSWRLKFDIGTDPNTGKRITKYKTVRGTRKPAAGSLRANLSRSAGYAA